MDTEITIKCGKIKGYTQQGVAKWLGIPYAKPPVGRLRFRRAQSCEPWHGVKDCRRFGNKPIQFLSYSRGRAVESEDCLYLNVWRPDDDRKNLPVFVWIYGGGFAFGESSDPGYDGSAFARDGIVFVSFNYRLGPLGYYPLKLGAPDAFDSNCGLSDQITALKWIRENIAAFGGNADNVTVAGESAGGSSVCYMLASPAAKGLFRKAIVQSGIPCFTFTDKTAGLHLEMFLRFIGLKESETYKLADMPAEAMKRAAKRMFTANSRYYPGLGQPGPIFDDLLPEASTRAVARGSAADVKLMIGTNRNEGSLFYFLRWFIRSWEQAEKMCRVSGCEEKLARLRALYAGEKSRRRQFAAMATDRLFLKDSILLADGHSRYNDVWMYRFDYTPRLMKLIGFGATHSCEIAPALGTLGMKKTLMNLPWTGTPKKVKEKFFDKLHAAWVNFAISGDPNGGSECEWDKYDERKRKTLLIDTKDRIAEDPGHDNFEVWKDMSIYE